MKRKFLPGLLFCMLLLAMACRKDARPAVESIFPGEGIAGTIVIITGGGFSTSYADNKVLFNGKPAFLQYVSKDTIKAEVPKGAGTGTVTVMVNGRSTTASDFKYILSPIVSNLAGNGNSGSANGYGSSASFYHPSGLITDAQGNIYVADNSNNIIRKITPAGLVTTLAGSTQGFSDGNGINAQFFSPTGVVADASGNIFVADMYNHKIRKITPAGTVTTFAGSSEGSADGTGTAAKFRYPSAVAMDAQGNIYVADQGNHRIRRISPAGAVTTFAGGAFGYGDGTGTQAKFDNPGGLVLDAQGNVYVSDNGNHRIRKITPAGVVSTFAGSTEGYADGTGAGAKFTYPGHLTIDSQGNIYVTDTGNDRIRKITPQGVVTTFAGSVAGYANGNGLQAKFSKPDGICADKQGRMYVSDNQNHRVRRIVLE